MVVVTPGRDLVGREGELRVVEQCLADVAAGHARVLLVGGDAGIGKTSVVGAAVAKAEARGFAVLAGHCLDIEAGIPFGPYVEALKPLLKTSGRDPLRPAAYRLASTLDPSQRTRARAQVTFLSDLLDAIEEAVASGPVLLVLEDLHWVERSTQDLTLAAARTVTGPLLLLLSFRTDELTRRHPFRSALVEIGRSAGARRLELGPLPVEAIRTLLEQHGQASDLPEEMRTIARCEGNPLYLEELLAARLTGVPAALSDLLLARLDAVSPEARLVLRAASVGGTQIDPEVVGVVVAPEIADLEGPLREAIDANLVRGESDQVAFRHGLLREAVHDDLLPGERRTWHSRFADALESRAGSAGTHAEMTTWGQVAFHRHAAHDRPAAFVASVRAGLLARRYGAAEAAGHLERALALWDSVPGAAELGGHARADLLVLLGEVVGGQGDFQRWKALVREAALLLEPGGDRLLSSRVYSALGVLVGYGVLDSGSTDETMQLAAQLAGSDPSPELAQVLVARAAIHTRRRHYQLALVDAMHAQGVAEAAGAAPQEVVARVESGVARIMLGQCRAGLGTLATAVRVAERSGQTGEALVQQGHLAWRHLMAGHIEEGLGLARRGRRDADAAGLPVAAAYCAEQEVECLQWQGRLDESDALLEELRQLGMPDYRWRIFRAHSLVDRGEAVAALEVEREIAADEGRSAEAASTLDVLRQVQLFVMLHDVAEALARANRLLLATADTDSPLDLAGSARVGYEALIEAVRAGVVPPRGMETRAADALAAAERGSTDEWDRSAYGLDLLIARGHARRFAGEPAVVERRTGADVAAVFGAGTALRPRLWLAEELLRGGDRDEGRVLLVQVWQSARAIGAGHVEAQAQRVATRTRVPLPRPSGESTEGSSLDAGALSLLAKLTPREREVLDVLATGATNKAIAGRLFISERTVGVHITRVLAKLDVTNRGQAAALARTLAEGDRRQP